MLLVILFLLIYLAVTLPLLAVFRFGFLNVAAFSYLGFMVWQLVH